MSNHQGPRAGSRAYKVLEHLVRIDRRAHVSDVRRTFAMNLTMGEFTCTVLESLARCGFVVENDGYLTITVPGKRYLQPAVVEAGPVRLPVASKYVAPMITLKNRFKNGPAVIRAGAFDYRDVPSRHGDQRLQHKFVIPGLGATQE
jgi:hypothetical protein